MKLYTNDITQKMQVALCVLLLLPMEMVLADRDLYAEGVVPAGIHIACPGDEVVCDLERDTKANVVVSLHVFLINLPDDSEGFSAPKGVLLCGESAGDKESSMTYRSGLQAVKVGAECSSANSDYCCLLNAAQQTVAARCWSFENFEGVFNLYSVLKTLFEPSTSEAHKVYERLRQRNVMAGNSRRFFL